MSYSLLTYLQDHAAGAEAACSLLGRLAERYANERLGPFFLELLTDVRADRQTLVTLLEQAGGTTSPTKNLSGRIAEWLSRPKLPLDDDSEGGLGLFEALEILALGILGKRSLWRALETIAAREPSLAEIDLRTLQTRAEQQFDRVERERLIAAVKLLAPPRTGT
jgi:hypothetical protein